MFKLNKTTTDKNRDKERIYQLEHMAGENLGMKLFYIEFHHLGEDTQALPHK